MRARATNDSILLPFTVKPSMADFTFGGATGSGVYDDVLDEVRTRPTMLNKHLLWRDTDSKYHFNRTPGADDQLIGLIESVQVSGRHVRFNVTVRGIVSVPIWWFTEDEHAARVHHIFGATFTNKKVLTTTGSFYKDRDPDQVEDDYDNTMKRYVDDPVMMRCVQCYFRV